jgi:hypothetical protein
MGEPVEPVVPSLSGISVRDTFLMLEEMVGADVVRRALASLPDAQRQQLEQAIALSWIPMSLVGAVVDEVARLAHRDPELLIDEAVRRAVSYTFKTAWRLLLRVTTDEALIARTPIIYAKSRNVGHLAAALKSHGRAELTLTDWPAVSDRQLRTIGIAVQTVLELAGRRNVRIQGQRTLQGAQYALTWQTVTTTPPS